MAEQYRVRRKRFVRSKSHDDAEDPNERTATVFEPGDLIEPTEAELAAFPSRFERVFVEQGSDEVEEEDPEEDESGE